MFLSSVYVVMYVTPKILDIPPKVRNNRGMSKTDKTTPYDFQGHWVEYHDHRNGVCDLPTETPRHWLPKNWWLDNYIHGRCFWHLDTDKIKWEHIREAYDMRRFPSRGKQKQMWKKEIDDA